MTGAEAAPQATRGVLGETPETPESGEGCRAAGVGVEEAGRAHAARDLGSFSGSAPCFLRVRSVFVGGAASPVTFEGKPAPACFARLVLPRPSESAQEHPGSPTEVM